MANMKEQLNLSAQKGNEKLKQELDNLYKAEHKQTLEIAEAQRKLQQAEIESHRARIAELESRGGCVVLVASSTAAVLGRTGCSRCDLSLPYITTQAMLVSLSHAILAPLAN